MYGLVACVYNCNSSSSGSTVKNNSFVSFFTFSLITEKLQSYLYHLLQPKFTENPDLWSPTVFFSRFLSFKLVFIDSCAHITDSNPNT